MKTTTIAAIATPIGNGGVGIIRISGPESLDILLRCFNKKKSEIKPRYAVFGTVSTGDFTDEVLVLYFPGPNSFTGENVVEIQAHGGAFLLQKLLEHILTLGATMAAPGEFSKRSFLNGKMSLGQAESIMDKIAAECESQLAAVSLVRQGALHEKLFAMEKELVNALAQIEATLDHPEDDIEHTTMSAIKPKLEKIHDSINCLIVSANEGRIMAHGIQVAVVGRPNVGKSSLFNAIINRQRSIVTDIAGTTTDTVSEAILYKGTKLVFNDTAGIRCDACSVVECEGIHRTKKVLDDCDIVLAIFDGSAPPTKEDEEILATLKGKEVIFALNKADLPSFNASSIAWKTPRYTTVCTSALKYENIDKLKELIYKSVINKVQKEKTTRLAKKDNAIITSLRHLQELLHARESLSQVLNNSCVPSLDMVATDLTRALEHIGNISGTRVSDAVIDEIFSQFCLGK